MKTHHNWDWPIAGYLFLGGLGGGAIIVSSVADVFFGLGDVFALGSLLTTVALALGSSLLVFELGRPFQFWRVFSSQKAIMTFGAWSLSLLIGTSFVYFTFWPSFSPWHNAVILRQALAVFNMVTGVAVCVYTGVLLGSLRARVFWNTPALPMLFLVSGISTGLAGQTLLAGLWPYTGSHAVVESVHGVIKTIDMAVVLFEIIVIVLYIMMMKYFGGDEAQRVADSWLSGSKSLAFWGGLLGMGLILPLVLNAIGGGFVEMFAAILALVGGLILRFLIVYSDNRTLMSGEAHYKSRLPKGNEEFLKALK